ncbi:sigma-54 dependent transcriptional regulator [Nitratidesulfovibrio sp. HK-II]|uniref:sigma-54-dependent transcriptional regulator n=1 Tax=Nitratidesulfovibrio sp. HK-II TaxID=2009266 RepID=UPI000E2EF3CC|nr:sigma-54 dependent transcriptional regulator [Nitratidesulfovibrio sp. HK-II]GBO97664.1 sigma-54 dependent DNA-binding response regulator [Nitratidesulfovibrio sp. HK-II]
MPTILVIDDDVQVCETIASLLARLRYACETAHTLEEGLRKLETTDVDVVFLDVRLPDGNGLDALPRIRLSPSRPEVIILTGEGDPDGAELAIQGGVWDYLVKPSPIKQTTLTLHRALQYREEKLSRGEAPAVALDLDGVVGTSPSMRQCFDLVAHAASSDANVLVTGETGTGKELFARTIHRNSTRRAGHFVVVDCAALTESLVESTLFGHRKGAFTSALADRDGLVKLADGGTLFLDEVGEMPLSIQRSFLRFLQERTFRPVGGTQEIKSDFRLISATNRDLDAMVERGEFRKDLLFRLKTVHVELPPLRSRPEDLKPLAIYHVNRLCEQYGVPHKGFSPDFFQQLAQYDWPGNVRELYNVLERSFVISGLESVLYALHLPQDIRIKITRAAIARPATGEVGIGSESATHPSAADGNGDGTGGGPGGGEDMVPPAQRADALGAAFTSPLPPLKGFKRLMERKYLEILIGQTRGNLQEMLDVSGLSRSHFYALLKKNNMSL